MKHWKIRGPKLLAPVASPSPRLHFSFLVRTRNLTIFHKARRRKSAGFVRFVRITGENCCFAISPSIGNAAPTQRVKLKIQGLNAPKRLKIAGLTFWGVATFIRVEHQSRVIVVQIQFGVSFETSKLFGH